jgi:GntR family transcriptional regulator
LADVTSRTLYKKVADDVRSQIASGALQVGDQIPSTTELGKRYGVSSTAARNAVAVLREEGLVEGIQGKGVFVAATPAEIGERRLSVQTVHDEVAVLRQEVRSLGQQAPDAPSAEVAQKLDALHSAVGQIQTDLRTLYDRLGQPYPHGQKDPKQGRRKSGA